MAAKTTRRKVMAVSTILYFNLLQSLERNSSTRSTLWVLGMNSLVEMLSILWSLNQGCSGTDATIRLASTMLTFPRWEFIRDRTGRIRFGPVRKIYRNACSQPVRIGQKQSPIRSEARPRRSHQRCNSGRFRTGFPVSASRTASFQSLLTVKTGLNRPISLQYPNQSVSQHLSVPSQPHPLSQGISEYCYQSQAFNYIVRESAG